MGQLSHVFTISGPGPRFEIANSTSSQVDTSKLSYLVTYFRENGTRRSRGTLKFSQLGQKYV